jgi:hypothetical protein
VKLNEFQQVNELDLAHVVGDYGAAGLKQIGNRLAGRPEGQLSVKDKMASDIFVRNFVGRAKTDLNAAIKSGLVDPNAGGAPAAVAPETPASQPAATTAAPTEPSAMGDMAKQLNVMPSTSTGGRLANTPTGITHKANATNPNQKPKATSRVGQARQKQAVKKAEIANAPYKPA